MTLELLHRRLFTVPMAAELLELGSTLRYWMYGRGEYLPALRDERNDDQEMTWGEFIEAAALRELRRTHDFSLQELRKFRDSLAEDSPGIRHPLATTEVLRNGRRLAYAIERAGEPKRIYEPATGQIAEEGAWVDTFMQRVDFRDVVPVLYRPDLEHWHVTISPERRYGAPTVEGIRTQGLWELVQAGETVESLANGWDVDEGLIQEAVNYERRRRRQLTSV